MLFQIKRLAGYILGFCLFYAPFALFQKSILYLFTGDWSELNIHDVCFRIQTEHLLDGKLFTMAIPFIAYAVILFLYHSSLDQFFVVNCVLLVRLVNI